MEGPINEKNLRETQRRLDHKAACNKLFSLVVLLLNFAKPAISLTFEQQLKFVMACIIRWVMYDKVRLASDTKDSQSDDNTGAKRTTLIAWSEHDVDIIEYGNEFDQRQPILPVGSKLSDVILDNNGNLKTELQNVFQGLNPWSCANFGPVECGIKSTQQKKKKAKDPCPVDGHPIILAGVLIRGTLLSDQQADKENSSGTRVCKRVFQPPDNENSLFTKRVRTESLQSIETRSYTAYLSLKNSSFIGFCQNFSPITGIRETDAMHRSPIDFLHEEDKCWSQLALALGVMGKWTQPCPYRLKTGNCLSYDYIYIECETQSLLMDTHQKADLMVIKSTVLSKEKGEQLIKETRTGLTQLLLELLNSGPRSQLRWYNEAALHQQPSDVRPNSNQLQQPARYRYSTGSDLLNQNHSQEDLIANQPIQNPMQQSQQYSDASAAGHCIQNSSSPAETSANDSGISDDQYLLNGVQISDQSATSITFDNSMSSEFEFDELLSLWPLTAIFHPRSAPIADSDTYAISPDFYYLNESNETE